MSKRRKRDHDKYHIGYKVEIKKDKEREKKGKKERDISKNRDRLRKREQIKWTEKNIYLVHGSSITWLNQTLCARVNEKFYGRKKNQTHSGLFIFIQGVKLHDVAVQIRLSFKHVINPNSI